MKAGTCKHYNGLKLFHRENCEAGIDVRGLVGGDDLGWMTRSPCLKKHETDITCDCYTEPTKQEIEEHESWINEVIERQKKTGPLITELKKEFGKTGGSGIRPCPVCGNDLHFTVASLNGHVWGKCKTQGCLNWME